MALTCMRMLVAIFSIAILLAFSVISFEVDLWSWGLGTHASLNNFFADAAPLHTNNPSSLADLMTDIDLRKDAKDHHEPQRSQEHNVQQPIETDYQVPPDVRDDTDAASTNPPTQFIENEPSDEPTRENPYPQEESPSTEAKENNIEADAKDQVTSKSPQHQDNLPKRRTRAKSFLVVFMGHSGSTAFTTELRTHSDFLVELLEPLDHGEYQFQTDKSLAKARELMDRGIAQGKIPGFKIRPFHVSNRPEEWRDFVKEYDTRIIWQYRENVIKQAVGEYRNKFLNDSSVIEGLMKDVEPCEKGSGQICRFKIESFRGLHELMNKFSTSDELLTEAVRTFRRDKEMHIVRYEDYLYNRERTMRNAFDFLGVDYQNTESQRRKASPDNLCEMVSNFQELCDHFMQCQLWRPFLTDAKNGCRCEPGRWQPFDPTFCKRDAWYQEVEK